MQACINNSLDVVKLLLEKYSDIINQKDNNGWTGFLYACSYNTLEIIKLLLKKHPDIINQKNIFGKTGYDYLTEDYKKFIANYI